MLSLHIGQKVILHKKGNRPTWHVKEVTKVGRLYFYLQYRSSPFYLDNGLEKSEYTCDEVFISLTDAAKPYERVCLYNAIGEKLILGGRGEYVPVSLTTQQLLSIADVLGVKEQALAKLNKKMLSIQSQLPVIEGVTDWNLDESHSQNS